MLEQPRSVWITPQISPVNKPEPNDDAAHQGELRRRTRRKSIEQMSTNGQWVESEVKGEAPSQGDQLGASIITRTF